MLGSDPPRPSQLFLTSPVAPCRLILPNYIPQWHKVGPRPPLQKAQVVKAAKAYSWEIHPPQMWGQMWGAGQTLMTNSLKKKNNLQTEVHKHYCVCLATVRLPCLTLTAVSRKLKCKPVWQAVMDDV